MAITVETRTDIIELIVGMVGAAPGATILSELADIVDGGLSLGDLAIALANNPAFKVLYPSFLTNEEFATNYLTQLMGDEVDADTLSGSIDAMVADLNEGTHRGAAMYSAITALSDAEEDDADFGAAATALANKTEVAIYYSVTTQQSADTLDELVAVVSGVSSSAASLAAGLAAVDGTDNAGQTFSLTTAVDAIAGTAGNDTIIAVINEDESTQTLNLGDSIDGGAGEDTIKFTTDGDEAPFNIAAISNVEHVVITDVDDDLNYVDLGGNAFSTANLVDFGDSNINLEGVLTSTDVTITDMNISNRVDITYDDEAGTDSINLEIAGTDANININVNNIETINFTASSGDTEDDVNLANLNFNDTDNLNIIANTDLEVNDIYLETDAAIVLSGAGDVDIANALANDETTVDATAMTGDLTVIAGAHNLSIKTGAGDDTVTTAAETLIVDLGAGDDVFDTNGIDYGAATAVDVNGGEGLDTVIINDGNNLTTAASAHFKSIEVLDVAGGTGTYDLEDFDFEGVDASADIAATVTIDNITDEDLTITGDQTGEIIYNLDDASGSSDELTLTIAGSSSYATDEILAGDVTINGIETVNLVSNQTVKIFGLYSYADNVISVLDSDDADTVVITGNETLTISAFETGAGVNTTIETIDASAASAFQMGAGVSTANVSIIGSAGRDVLVVGDTTGAEDGLLNDGTGSTINAGLGGDQVTYTDAGAVDTYILDAGDSQLGYFDNFFPTDTAGDGAYTAAADLENFDIITGFVSGEDTLDLGSFGFTGTKASAFAGPTLSAAGLLALVDGTTTTKADFFVDTGVTRGVAVVAGIDTTTVGGTAGSTVIFIDSNGDGDFTVADDDAIVLSGTATIGLGDVGF